MQLNDMQWAAVIDFYAVWRSSPTDTATAVALIMLMLFRRLSSVTAAAAPFPGNLVMEHRLLHKECCFNDATRV